MLNRVFGADVPAPIRSHALQWLQPALDIVEVDCSFALYHSTGCVSAFMINVIHIHECTESVCGTEMS